MKFIFELEGESDWPPVNAESLWFDEHECGFQLKSIPFFVPNLAYDDVVDLEILSDTHAAVKAVVQHSGNSTIWAYLREGVDEEAVLSLLSDSGIGTEGGALEGYFALNLPEDTSFSVLQNCLADLLASDRAEIALGSMRHRN